MLMTYKRAPTLGTSVPTIPAAPKPAPSGHAHTLAVWAGFALMFALAFISIAILPFRDILAGNTELGIALFGLALLGCLAFRVPAARDTLMVSAALGIASGMCTIGLI